MTRGPLTPHTVLYAEKKKSCENKTSLGNVIKKYCRIYQESTS